MDSTARTLSLINIIINYKYVLNFIDFQYALIFSDACLEFSILPWNSMRGILAVRHLTILAEATFD
jgi:hypothetical protein